MLEAPLSFSNNFGSYILKLNHVGVTMNKLFLLTGVGILLCTLNASAFQSAPDFFLNPPADTEYEIYGIGDGLSEEAAFAIAMANLAEKVEQVRAEEVENFSAISNSTDESTTTTSRQIVNQDVFRFQVQSLNKMFMDESSSGEFIAENFELAIRVYYKADEECSYQIEHFYEYSNEAGNEDDKTAGSIAWNNCSFDHSKRYIEENPEISYTFKEVSGTYYAMVSLMTSAIDNEE